VAAVRAHPYGPIYTSTNSGTTWDVSGAPVDDWVAVTSSADGSKLAALNSYGGIYASTNAGATWSTTRAPGVEWQTLASSADGAKLVAAGGWIYNSPLFVSVDSGISWTTTSASGKRWSSVALSADGSKLVGTVMGGGIYTAQSTPRPSLNLAPSGSNALLSWTIPSVDFTLQQNSDLTTTNWTDVTTPPVLNLTNLQNQVLLSPPSGNTFYRLKH
jgi:hypothetical protein